jgi:hypothetical protein
MRAPQHIRNGKKEMTKKTTELAIFDLDGCLSNDAWRQSYIGLVQSEGRYDYYHQNLEHDTPLIQGVEILAKHVLEGRRIIFITARPLKFGTATHKWIKERLNLKNGDYIIYMRPSGDNRGSVELKRDVVQRLKKSVHSSKGAESIYIAYDDRDDVVNMYREEGIYAWVLDKDGVRAPIQTKASVELSNANADPEFDAILKAAFGPTAEAVGAMLEESAKFPMVTRPAPPTPTYKPARAEDPSPTPPSAADILSLAADTVKASNAVYKDNFRMVGEVIAALFPNGVKLDSAKDHEVYHLLVMVVGKLTRFAVSGLTHQDSIRDLTVYAAMVEAAMNNHNIEVL